MNIIEVNSKKDKKDFIQIACSIYKNEKNWIRPLDKDINSVFDPKTNKAFRKGDVKRWILKNNNETIGRIAAFYSSKNDKEKLRVGGCGFFECIDDEEAAKMLFDTAKNWLEKNGYNSMDGPINFGERDKWWGCLVEGFDIDPNYLQNYGKAYYQKLFENYGFQLLFRQLTFLKKVRTPLSEKLSLKAERALRDPNYNFKTLEKRNIQKYIRDFTKIYNDAWSKYPGVSKLELSQAKLLFAQLKPILDEKILWFAYHNNDPVGFFISIPEMNQIFKHVNGKLDLFGKLKTFYHLKIKNSCKKMVGLVFGIVPKHQGKGVDGALIMASRETIQEKLAYEDLELNWIPDFNKSMIRVAEQVQVKLGKIHHTYRYNFDRSIPVERITKK
ncbi:MAG: hypothetical protein VW741_04625 [Flammeovirgaceae bacterium]|tara:strand:+ start:483 stop:1640 length:1158 start_codon:yes stop_codon:yes gene_type:complete